MKKFRNLLLILSGFVLGVSISFSPQISAATNKLLGSKVSNVLNVKIDNKTIGSGAVIDGTTYIPLRVTAKELGMEVEKVDSSEVILSSIENTTPPEPEDLANKAKEEQDAADKRTAEINERNSKISSTKREIEVKKDSIEYLKKGITELEGKLEDNKLWASTKEVGKDVYEQNIGIFQKELDEAKLSLNKQEKELADLEAQLAELNNQ